MDDHHAHRLTADVEREVRRAVVANGVRPDDTDDPLLRAALHDAELRDNVTQWADSEGLTGPWLSLLLQHGVSDERLLRTHRDRVMRSLACEAMAVRAVETLQAAGIESWLLKGIAAANADHDDPAMRTSVDADLLVRRRDLHRAVAALDAVGQRRAEPAPRPGWETRHARTVLLHGPEHLELDLHLSLATGYFGSMLPMADILAEHETVELAGVRCAVLTRTARALHSCYAAVLNRGGNLRYLRDLVVQLGCSEAQTAALIDLSRAADGQAVVARAAAMATQTGLLDEQHPLVVWGAAVRPSARARRALRFADGAHAAGWSADARSAMLAMGPLQKVGYLFEFVVPPRGSGRGVGRTIRSAVRFVRSR